MRGDPVKIDAAARRVLQGRRVPRPRLIALLEHTSARVIVLTAPAGYGKTALAMEWLGGRPRVGWYAASPASADLAAFCVELAGAAAIVVPGAGERLRRRARVEEVPERAARPLAELLAEDLAAWPDDAWLVVDDYHTVAESAAVEQFVDHLLATARLRLLVTTRRRPSWASARRILYGEVAEITRDELAMTDEEARLLLEDRASDAVSAIVAQAEGWPALLGLAALAGSLALPETRVAGALYRYFADELLQSEPPEIREFMLAASLASRIDVTTARDVLGFPDAELALGRLEEEGLLYPGPDTGARRFHPLLRDFLRQRLVAEDGKRAAALARRLVASARSEGRLEEAFVCSIEAGLQREAAAIAAEAAPALLEAGRIETVERWLSLCGEAALAEPALRLAQAEVLMRRGQLFEAAAVARELTNRLAATDEHVSRAWCLAGRAAHLLSHDEDALECHLRARETARHANDLTNALWGATVVAAQLESEIIDELVSDLEDVASNDVDTRLQHASGRAFLASRRSTLAGAWKSLEPLVHLVDRATDPMAASSFLVAAAYLNVARADYRAAVALIERCLALCDEFRLGMIKRAFCLCHRAGAEIGLRQLARAERTLAELARLHVEHTQVLVSEQRILRAKLALAKGDAASVLEHAPPPGADEPPAAVGEHAALAALAAASLGDAARCELEAARAREVTGAVEARSYAAFALAVSQLASRGGSEDRQAAADLVGRAARDEILDAFVIAYRAWPPLLAAVAENPAARAIVHELVPRTNDFALARKMGVAVAGAAERGHGLELLTARENEVLHLMADGLGNAEIARRLFISEKTLKVHVHHIFQKLGVSTRVQAVLASREPVGKADT